MTTTNVPSDQFDDLKRDVEDATRYSNSETVFTNRVGKQIRPIALQAQDIADNLAAAEQALANSGFIPKGDFTNGGTAEAKNEVFSDGTDYWRYDGALPFTVTAGSSPTPTGVGAWINVSDSTLRSQLAASGSSVLISGVEAAELVGRVVTPEQFGSTGVNDSAAINSALAVGLPLFLKKGKTYDIDATLNLPDDSLIFGNYAKFLKSFNGDAISSFGRRSAVRDLEMDGNGLSFSGRNVVIDIGDRTSYEELGLQKLINCNIHSSRGREVDYTTATKGTFSQIIGCKFNPLPVSQGGGGVAIAWPNEPVGNGNRHIIDCYCAGVLLFDQGCDNGMVKNNTVGTPDSSPSIILSTTSKKIAISGNRFAHGNNLLTFAGQEHVISGNIISSQVAFDPNCTFIRYSSDNFDAGLSGSIPYQGNFIDTGKINIPYTPTWTSSGDTPSFGNADVRCSYQVSNKKVRVEGQIIFGSTTVFGTGVYTLSLPILSGLTKSFSGSAWVQGYNCSVLATPNAGTFDIYYEGSRLSNNNPVTLSSGNRVVFDVEYEIT